MSTRKKPDFAVGGGGLVDPEFVSGGVRSELLLHLKKAPLTDEQKNALIDYANDISQMVCDGELQPAAQQKQQIESIASDARRLLASLHALDGPALEALHAHADYLAFGTKPPVELNRAVKHAIRQPGGSLAAGAWDWVHALEMAADYAAQQYAPTTTSKPSQMRARGLVALLAEHIRAMTGNTPPKDQASWFAAFVACLGEHLGLEIGPRIVASGIGAIR